MSIGPQLPPHLQKSKETREENGSKQVINIGPPMPPEFLNSGSRIGPIGPSIPPEFFEKLQNSAEDDEDFLPEEDAEESEEDISSSYGPALPPDLIPSSNSVEDLDENAEDVGPLPECPETKEENYEERLLKLRYEKAIEESAAKNKREAWMTELPEGMRQYGLQARGFKQRYESEKSREESRTAWTDQPGTAASKSSTKNDGPVKAVRERDRKLGEQAEKFNKSRKESLLDEHARKRKADEEADASKPKERRPFNRDEDLKTIQLNRLNRAEIAEKAKVLGSRFGPGKDARFL